MASNGLLHLQVENAVQISYNSNADPQIKRQVCIGSRVTLELCSCTGGTDLVTVGYDLSTSGKAITGCLAGLSPFVCAGSEAHRDRSPLLPRGPEYCRSTPVPSNR